MSNVVESPRDVEKEAVSDEAPVLAGVAPEFLPAELSEGVDLESMPPLKDMNGLLPSKRTRIKAKAGKIGKQAEGLKSLGAEGVSDEDLLDDLDAVADLMESAEGFVLDMAQNSEDMTAWLIAQDNPEAAVMSAFTKAAEALGN